MSTFGPDLILSLVPLATACVSLVATAFLLCRLQSLNAARRRRLLVRQLHHMALANLVYLITEVTHQVVRMDWVFATRDPGTREPVVQQTDFTCRLNEVLQDVGSRASLLFELHIAVAFAASIVGSYKTMRFLSAALPYTWIPAILIGSIEAFLVKAFWNPDVGCRAKGQDFIVVVFNTLGFVVCAACYVASSFSVGRAGESVQRSVWKKIRLYPLVALVTLLPFIVYFLDGPLTNGQRVGPYTRNTLFFLVATTLYDLGGLLTFLVYAWQSKYVRSNARSARSNASYGGHSSDGVPRELSFRVNFRLADSVVEDLPGTPTHSDSLRSAQSLVLEYYDNSYHSAVSAH